MPTSARVLNGSTTKGSKTSVVYPPEFSGSNAADRYLQGIECKTVESLIKYFALKPQPINDFLRVRNGKIIQPGTIFDDCDQESLLRPTSAETVTVVFSDSSNNKSGLRSAINHSFDRRDLGQGIFTHHDGTPYEDNISENPLEVMNALDNSSFSKLSLDENGLTSGDGFIDPLEIRNFGQLSVMPVFLRPTGLKIFFGSVDNLGRTITLSQAIEKNNLREISLEGIRGGLARRSSYLAGYSHYLDAFGHFGSIPTEGYVQPDTSEILPFLDGKDIEITSNQITDDPNQLMKDALLELDPSLEDDLFDRNHISCTAGFVYNNCDYGTDSISYGGLKR